jgi:sulfatase maturation enzyme AslB (radical SAM superfamily)
MVSKLHRTDERWLRTTNGEPRGFIDPRRLRELWFHTGTACNLRCPDCFEHSAPGDQRLESLTFDDVKPFIDEAVDLNVEQFSFTGGEPFVIKDIVRILDYALDHKPCLVLTNGTRPLHARLAEILPLIKKPHRLSFRVSLDYPNAEKHDAGRGDGMFALALDALGRLHRAGFHVSVARRREDGEDLAAVTAAFQTYFESVGLPDDTPIIAFPNLTPSDTPEITETCMSTYHTPSSCEKFMCAFSRMVVKKGGIPRVYACTLVDDDPCYDLGSSLKDSANVRVTLGHSRCFACFAGGASCSEID